jgi:hypothetical protein
MPYYFSGILSNTADRGIYLAQGDANTFHVLILQTVFLFVKPCRFFSRHAGNQAA